MVFGHLVVGFSSDMVESVDVEVDSPLAHSIINGYEPTSPSHNSSTGSSLEPEREAVDDAADSCQCPPPPCAVCGSLVQRGTYCPNLCDLIVIEDED